jgi:flagellar basal-body rod protein FlgB
VNENPSMPKGHRLAFGLHSHRHMLDSVGASIEQYMNLVSTRQKLVASNIANADTPGYQTKDIDFSAELANQMSGSKPNVIEVSGLKNKNDGNNVDMDREARLLAENALRFSVASNLAHSEISTLRTAINEGAKS